MGKQRKIKVGDKFGRLTTIKPTKDKTGRNNRWICQCECGNQTEVYSFSLISGGIKSCGCSQKEYYLSKSKAMIGERYGRLVVIRPTDKRKGNMVVMLCKCDCGNYKEVVSCNLRNGGTTSCGCARSESSKRTIKIASNTAHQRTRNATIDTPAKANSTLGIRNVYYVENNKDYSVVIVRNKISFRKNGIKTLEEALEIKKEVLERYKNGDTDWNGKV
jgi:hypothetical protein